MACALVGCRLWLLALAWSHYWALGWLVSVLITQGVEQANRWAGVLGTTVVLSGALGNLMIWWAKNRLGVDASQHYDRHRLKWPIKW